MGTKYATMVDTSPHNAYYERPAMLTLLPDVLTGLRVLDAGTAAGWYAKYFLDNGARPSAVDISPTMVRLAKARLGNQVAVFQADLGQPLIIFEDACFDLVVCSLVLHYIEDWTAVLSEFHRILRENGMLLFSINHPTTGFLKFQPENYFKITQVEDEWGSLGKVRFFQRSLSSIFEALYKADFVVERVIEPLPTPEFRKVLPEYSEHLLKHPDFLLIRARRE